MKLFTRNPSRIKYAKIKVDPYLEGRLQAIFGDFVLCTVGSAPGGQFTVAVDGGDDGGATCWLPSITQALELFEEIKRQQPLTLDLLTRHNFDIW